MEFKKHTRRERKQTSYNPEEEGYIKCGKKVNIYNLIQESREDTEIYGTLEKYGCIKTQKLSATELAEAYGDFRNAADLRTSIEQVKAADDLWYSLPLEMRREFGHSKAEFLAHGEEYLKNKLVDQQRKEEFAKNGFIEEKTVEPKQPMEKVDASN